MALKHPDCALDASECRITRDVPPHAEPIAWEPVYDGNGNMVNSDPNVTVAHCACATCGREWDEAFVSGGLPKITTTKGPRDEPAPAREA